MKKANYIVLISLFIACSPYKKVTLTMSDKLTNRFKGYSEGAVLDAVGKQTKRINQPDGYILRFDYSYALSMQLPTASNPNAMHFSARAGDPYGNRSQANKNNTAVDHNYINGRSAADSVIKFTDFYFDRTKHVTAVYAEGYPDSVYYVKRR
jgi:hypothetical protein